MKGERRRRPAGIVVKMPMWMDSCSVFGQAQWSTGKPLFFFTFFFFFVEIGVNALENLTPGCWWGNWDRLSWVRRGGAQTSEAQTGQVFALLRLLCLPCSIVHSGLWLFPHSCSSWGQSCIPGSRICFDGLPDVLKWVGFTPVKFSFSVTHCFFKKKAISVVAMESPAYPMRLNHRIYSAAAENVWKYVCRRAAVLRSLAAL